LDTLLPEKQNPATKVGRNLMMTANATSTGGQQGLVMGQEGLERG